MEILENINFGAAVAATAVVAAALLVIGPLIVKRQLRIRDLALDEEERRIAEDSAARAEDPHHRKLTVN